MHGVKLADPDGLLQGAGNQGGVVRLTSAGMLGDSAIEALIQRTLDQAKVPMTGRGYTVVKSVSATPRPRRPSSA
jgi:hypothetical protein